MYKTQPSGMLAFALKRFFFLKWKIENTSLPLRVLPYHFFLLIYLIFYRKQKDDDVDQQRVTFVNTPQLISTTRVQSKVTARTPTPYQSRSGTPQLITNNAWTYTKTEMQENVPQNTSERYGNLTSPSPYNNTAERYGNLTSPSPYSYQDQYKTLDRPSSRQRTPSRQFEENYNFVEAYNNARNLYYGNNKDDAYDPDVEDQIRDHLVQQQIESYERQIEHERTRLATDREKEFQSHIRRSMTPNYLNEKAIIASVRDHSKHTPPVVTLGSKNISATKPPIPKPPMGNQPFNPKTTYPRYRENRKKTHHSRSVRPNSTSGWKQQRYTKYMPNGSGELNGALLTKRVSFNTSRPGSASASLRRDNKKGSHFFQWRDNVPAKPSTSSASRPVSNELWKMPRFTKSAKPRIDSNLSDENTRFMSKLSVSDPNNIKVNVECAEGDNVDVAVSFSNSPDEKVLSFL